jgi:glycosyltransferase involved in cell wall biosynthesis
MADVPTISVLMPAYNATRYLREAIDSVLAQSFADFELILLDDGSTDQTPQVLKEYAWRDARIRVHGGANRGISQTLNDGLAMARGEFIARMDADDISLPERFAKQVRFLREHPEHVLVGSRCMMIDPEGFPICEKFDIALDHEEINASLMKMGWPLVHPAVMMRAAAVRSIGGYDVTYRTNQDHDLFLRLAEIGRLANLPEVLLKYRQHLQSVGTKKLVEDPKARTVFQIVKAAHDRRGIGFIEPQTGKPGPATPMELRMNWWWWSLQAGNVSTARRHAWSMLREAPWSGTSWRAVYCALRGH